jgi:FlgD Ig-like domain
MKFPLFPLTVLIALALPATTHAQWTTNGIPLVSASGQQLYPVSITDGTSGVIVAWQDRRAGNFDIYAQRITDTGFPQWPTNGVALCTAAGNQSSPQIVSDGAGGAIVTWYDRRNGTDDNIYVQRISPAGVPMWKTDGVAVCTATDDQTDPRIAPDGLGGAIIAWNDNRSTIDYDTYVQRVDGTGAVQYAANGVVACAAAGNQFLTALVPNSTGAVIAIWYDDRNGTDSDIYAQRVNVLGGISWAAGGVPLCSAAGDQDSPSAVSDGSGGAIVTWEDLRDGFTYDVYAQRIYAGGTVAWAANGVAVCAATDDQSFPVIASDASGGAIVSWHDMRNGVDANIYAQRLNGAGAGQWTANGVALCTAASGQDNPTMVADGFGGAIMTWNDARNGNPDVYAQRVNASGAVQWTADGIPVVSASAQQSFPTVVAVASGGAIFTWNDFRTDVVGDIYTLRLEGSGQVPAGIGDTPSLSMALGNNYPNPFATRTTLALTLEHEADVSVEVFDVAGHRVREMRLGSRSAGASELFFDGLDDHAAPLASGVYFYRVRAGREAVTKKILLAR